MKGSAINKYTWIVGMKKDYPDPVKLCASLIERQVWLKQWIQTEMQGDSLVQLYDGLAGRNA